MGGSRRGGDEAMIASFQEPRRVFDRLRKKFGGYRPLPSQPVDPESSQPYGQGRDPGSVGDAFDGLSAAMGWSSHLARAELMVEWPDLVGPEVAAHATPVSSDHGVIEVVCDSSAWATQLRLIRGSLLAKLVEKFPEADISEIRINAPGAPSWKHGSRSVPGRGPRDTYG